MSTAHTNNFPKLHNAAWPGVVGKGPDSEPPIDLDTMLDLTAAAEVDGVKFDGVDLFLFAPARRHRRRRTTSLKQLADKVPVAQPGRSARWWRPVWPPTGGGSAMGDAEERKQFVEQVRKGCRIAKKLRELGVRPYGVVRIDSACSPSDWAEDPDGNQKKIAETFREACDGRRGPRRAPGRRGRNLLGRHAQLEEDGRAAGSGRPPADARLPGRHGAHAVVPARLQRPGGPHPARRTSTGTTRPRSTTA